MARVCYSTHVSIKKHLLNSISSFKTVPRGATLFLEILVWARAWAGDVMAGAGSVAQHTPDV